MANNKKRSTYVVTTKVTVPASTATSSVITATSGSNHFSLDAADANFKTGAWIYDATNSELYLITDLAADGKSGTIQGTFNDTLSGATIAVITKEDAKVSKIYMATKDAVTVIDGANVPADYSINDEISTSAQVSGAQSVEPYIVDAATNSSSVLVQVYKFPK